MAEAIPGRVRGSGAEPGVMGLVETLKYIREREESLSRYSDKLRQSLVEIAGQFGRLSEKYCMRCGYHADAHRDDSSHYERTCKNLLLPTIEVSITFRDKESFAEKETLEHNFSYYLAINEDHELVIQEINWDIRECPNDIYFSNAPRWLLKELVKSGRLSKFFEALAGRLAELNDEYRDAAEKAEKIAKAVEEAAASS